MTIWAFRAVLKSNCQVSGQLPTGHLRSSQESERSRVREACSLLLSLDLLEVEIKLSAFKNVAIETAGLSWAGGNAGEQVVGVELVGELGVDFTVGLSVLHGGFYMAGPLLISAGLIRFFNLLLVKLNVVVLKVPLSEWGSIDSNDSVLNKGLSAHKFVIGSVVDNIENAGLATDAFGAPGESAGVDAESAVLEVATTTADERDLLGTKLGVCGHPSHLELSLFLVHGHATTS